MYALTALFVATRAEMRAALPAWTPPAASKKERAERGPATTLVVGGGDYEEHLTSLLPEPLHAVPHVVLKNVTLSHLTALSWSLGVELDRQPDPVLVSPDGVASIYPFPPPAMRRIASATDSQKNTVARKLARSAAFTDFAWGVHEARELLRQITPLASVVEGERAPFALVSA